MTPPLVDVTGRRQLRRREARLRLARRLGVVAALLALVGGALWVLYGSTLLVARSVRVTGNSLVSVEEVLAAASVPLGTPLVGLDAEGIATRVGEVPAVQRAAVERVWPSTVAIAVTERQVRLVVAREGGFDWVDAEGVSFHHTGTQPNGTMVAEASQDEPRLLAAMVSVANALPPKVRDRATSMSARTEDSIVVQLSDGARVMWGSSESSPLKAEVIAPLLDVKAVVYDVSSPTHPTTRGR